MAKAYKPTLDKRTLTISDIEDLLPDFKDNWAFILEYDNCMCTIKSAIENEFEGISSVEKILNYGSALITKDHYRMTYYVTELYVKVRTKSGSSKILNCNVNLCELYQGEENSVHVLESWK